jgi:ElaB/YqjD/DUF883 family membrane-anchored ribosome-binding protein
MFWHASSELAPSARAIQAHLGSIEQELENLGKIAGRRGYAAANDAGDRAGDALTSIYNEMAERFRRGGRHAAKIGSHYGNDALDRASSEVRENPLVTLGVAAAVGFLIGAAIIGASRFPAQVRRGRYEG